MYYLREKSNFENDFKENQTVFIKESPTITIKIDTSSYVSSIKSKSDKSATGVVSKISKKEYYDNYEFLVDWNKIYYNILKFKKIRNYANLYFNSIAELKLIFNDDKLSNIEVFGNKELFNIDEKKTFGELQEFKYFLEDLYVSIIKEYITILYTSKLRKMSESLFILDSLKDEDIIPSYTIRIEVDKNQQPKITGNMKEIIEKLLHTSQSNNDIDVIKTNLKSFIDLKQNRNCEFMIEFDKHIFSPLLIAQKEGYSLSPAGLNEGEKEFVEKLKLFLSKNVQLTKNKEIVLLRNNENKGIGFYLETKKFYYDFILWIITKNSQKIIFIDPKGLVHIDKEKMNFNKDGIGKIQKQLELKEKNKNFELGCYIISQTHPTDIQDDKIKKSLEDYNVYYKDDVENFFEKIFN